MTNPSRPQLAGPQTASQKPAHESIAPNRARFAIITLGNPGVRQTGAGAARIKDTHVDRAQIYETLNEVYFSATPHEAETLAHLPLLLEGARVAIDAGASLGPYTRALSRALPQGEIHAVEADPVRYEELARNCHQWSRKNGNSVTAHHYALTNGMVPNGETSFFVTYSNVSGGLDPEKTTQEARAAEWHEITVPAASLDELFADKDPDFIKVDVEGLELAVLEGARRILAKGKTNLLVEVHNWSDEPGGAPDVLNLMRSNGYYPANFFDRTAFVTDRRLWLQLKGLDLRYRIPQALRRRIPSAGSMGQSKAPSAREDS